MSRNLIHTHLPLGFILCDTIALLIILANFRQCCLLFTAKTMITECSCCCSRQVSSVMSNSARPHGLQPTRLPRPWDSPGKNSRVGCHFLLQCMKVKSESEFAQSCPTLRDPMDYNPPGSSIHGIFRARTLEWGAIAFSKLYS